MAEMHVEKLSSLIPDDRNANKGTERGAQLLRKSIKQYGAGRSVLLDKNGVLIAGNKTAQEASQAGIEDVIIVKTTGKQLVAVQRTDIDLDSKQGRELAIADNRVGQISLEWDGDVLSSLADEGVDLSQFFNTDEIAEIIGITEEPPADPGAQIDKADELLKKWQVVRGDLWEIGNHRLLCGDSTSAADVDKLMQGEKADFIFADPPYGISIVDVSGSIGAAKPFGSKNVRGSIGTSNIVSVGIYAPIVGDETTDTAIKSAHLLLEKYPDAFHVWWGGNYYANALPNSACWIVWDKQNTGNFADVEMAWTNSAKGARLFSHMWNGMLKASERGIKRVHPTQKPVELAKYCLDTFGAGVEIALDPFCGSGMSLVACEQMNCKGRGLELSPDYCSVILERLSLMGLTSRRISNG